MVLSDSETQFAAKPLIARPIDITLYEAVATKAARLVGACADERLNTANVSAFAGAFGHPANPQLVEAMRYSMLGGGKRFRASLCCATAQIFAVDDDDIARVATAIELVHCYALIHDDLPCMDDDDMRRGRASLHKVYGEAMAILAGDALLTLAFEVLADFDAVKGPAGIDANGALYLELIRQLARASGMQGMVGGQAVDIKGVDAIPSAGIEGLVRLGDMKTGALIQYAVQAGAILGGASARLRGALLAYAQKLGLAFQIVDDILDVEGKGTTLGKTPGKDAATQKMTFVSHLGIEGARAKAHHLVETARDDLAIFDTKADALRQATEVVIWRQN